MTEKRNKVKQELGSKKQQKTVKENKIGKAAHSLIDGSFLMKDKVVRLLPFALYITLLTIIYVANSYYAEKSVMEIDRLKRELEELRFQEITTKSDLMHLSKQSEVAKTLESQGIKESTIPPHKIVTTTNKN